MNISENEFRDYLFEHHKNDLAKIIVGKRNAPQWTDESFPPIHFLLQKRAEEKINNILDDLDQLVITSKELRLSRGADSVTRIDLFGHSESSGIAILELKKSGQTERQAFTELLAYSNHFCSLFPGLKETAVTLVLIAPMEGRTVRDAYVQELVANNKNIIALIPREDSSGKFTLEVFYPDATYYRWFENNLLDDRSMLTVAVSFPIIEGWIDSDINSDQRIPDYSKNALNTISSAISHKLEANGFHSLTYAAQQWGEIATQFPYPNTIYVVIVNPFASFKTSVDAEGNVYGDSHEGRLHDIQAIHEQLSENNRDYWIDILESNFHGRVIKLVEDEFTSCFANSEGQEIEREISTPDWYGLKTSVINAVCVHNLDINLTGLLREIYAEYMQYAYTKNDGECIYYGDDMPMFLYKSLRPFLPVWEILCGLGFGESENEDECDEEDDIEEED